MNQLPLDKTILATCAVCYYGNCTDFRYALECSGCEKFPILCNQCRMVDGKSLARCRWCGLPGRKTTLHKQNYEDKPELYWFLYAMWDSYCCSNPQKRINWRDFLTEIRPIMPFIKSQVAKGISFYNFIDRNRGEIHMLIQYMMCMRGVPHLLFDLHTIVVRRNNVFLFKDHLYLKVMSPSSCTDYVAGTFMKFTANRLILPILQYYPRSGKRLRELWKILFLQMIQDHKV